MALTDVLVHFLGRISDRLAIPKALKTMRDEVEARLVAIEGGGDLTLRTDLADTSNAKGAALVAVEDAAGIYVGATSEAVLAEIGVRFLAIPAADPGTGVAIPVTRSATIGLTIAGAETNTLARPTYEGQELVLYAKAVSAGARVVTVTGNVNQTGNNTLTFAQVQDAIVLKAMKSGASLIWVATGNDGVALSTV